MTQSRTTSATKADEAIQSALLGEAVESADVAVFVFDDDGNHVAANSSACALTGYTREELLQTKVRELGTDSSRALEWIAEVARGARPAGSGELRRKDGSTLGVDYRVTQATIGGIPFLVGLCWPAEAPA